MDYKLNIIEICGKNIVSREDGKKVHDIIADKWKEYDRVVIDFGDVLIASVSFIDEIFGQLALEYTRNELTAKIHPENIQEFDRALLNDVVRSRLRQKDLKQEAH